MSCCFAYAFWKLRVIVDWLKEAESTRIELFEETKPITENQVARRMSYSPVVINVLILSMLCLLVCVCHKYCRSCIQAASQRHSWWLMLQLLQRWKEWMSVWLWGVSYGRGGLRWKGMAMFCQIKMGMKVDCTGVTFDSGEYCFMLFM